MLLQKIETAELKIARLYVCKTESTYYAGVATY